MWAFTAPGDGLTALTVPRGLPALLFGWPGLPASGVLGSLCAQQVPDLMSGQTEGGEGAGVPSASSGSRLHSSSVGCVWKVWRLLSPGCDSGAGTEVLTMGPVWPLGECLSPSHSWVASDGQSVQNDLVHELPGAVLDMCVCVGTLVSGHSAGREDWHLAGASKVPWAPRPRSGNNGSCIPRTLPMSCQMFLWVKNVFKMV